MKQSTLVLIRQRDRYLLGGLVHWQLSISEFIKGEGGISCNFFGTN